MNKTIMNFAATLQFGVVTQVDLQKHQIKARIPALDDLETAFLPFLTLANGAYSLPLPNETVVLLLDARGEGGVGLGVTYTEVDPPPFGQDLIGWRFPNGDIFTHCNQTGNVFLQTQGCLKAITKGDVAITTDANATVTAKGNIKAQGANITLTAQGTISLNAQAISLNAPNSNASGNMAVKGISKASDHISGGISGKGHTHGQNPGDHYGGGADTNPPK